MNIHPWCVHSPPPGGRNVRLQCDLGSLSSWSLTVKTDGRRKNSVAVGLNLCFCSVQSTEAVGDWRKNIEDKADRKKMFETS